MAKISKEWQMEMACPVDFSFRTITSLQQKEKEGKKGKEKSHMDIGQNEEDTAIPLDFSFKKITKLDLNQVQGARSSRCGAVPEKGNISKKYLTRSVWLNNNKLTNIKNVENLITELLDQPEKLGWIDFSFNYITEIDEEIAKFSNLKIVYFHGNKIKEITEICKLRTIKELRSVTFHGNPIANHRDYRAYALTYLPQILNLDFTPITKLERFQPKPVDAVRYVEAYDAQHPTIATATTSKAAAATPPTPKEEDK